MKIILIVLLVFFCQCKLALGQTDSIRFFKTKQGALIYDPYFSIGTQYSWDGEIKNGFADGKGTCRFLLDEQEIAVLTGTFTNGIANGECKFSYKYLDIEIKCNYTEGRMLGIGSCKSSNSDLYTGELRDLTIHGTGKLVYSRGSVFEGTFRFGKFWTGTFIDLNDKRSLYYRAQQVDSLPTYTKYLPKLNEEVTEYFDSEWNRCKKNEASYYRKITYSKPNTPFGEVKDFYISGQIHSKYHASFIDYTDKYMTFYGPGKMKSYFENGNVSFENNYDYKGEIIGLFQTFYENGILKTKCYYANNMLNGDRLDYDEKGILTNYAVYENGHFKDGKYFAISENLWTAEYDEDFEENYEDWDPNEENVITDIWDSGEFFVQLTDDKLYFKTKEYIVNKDLQFSYSFKITTRKKTFKKDAYVGFIFDYKNTDNFAYILIDPKLKVNFVKVIDGISNSFGETYKLQQNPEEKKSDVLRFNLIVTCFLNGITFYINEQEVNFLKRWDWIGNEYGAIAHGNISFTLDNIHTREFYDPETSKEFTDYLEKNVLNADYSAEDSGYDGNGTGFFISKNGYLVTNYHVVEDAKVIEVQLTINGKIEKYLADVVVSDKINDLVILKITDTDFKMDQDFPYGFQFESEDVGSEVFTMGYPLADVMGNEIKFTDGKISSKSGINGDIRMYQISTPIQPGNSGGPLFNASGNVVGIVSATLNRENYNSENVNYALKLNLLKNLIDSAPEKIIVKETSTDDKNTISDKIKSYESFIPMILVKL